MSICLFFIAHRRLKKTALVCFTWDRDLIPITKSLKHILKRDLKLDEKTIVYLKNIF
jgi:hypothetical protein